MNRAAPTIGLCYDLRADFPWRPGLPRDADADWDIAETIDEVRRGLEVAGYSVVDIGGSAVLRSESSSADLILSLCEGVRSRFREALVSAYCEQVGQPYLLSAPDSLVIALDKNLSCLLVRQAGVQVPVMSVVAPGERLGTWQRYPAVVKPVAEGSGMGVVAVETVGELDQAVARIHAEYGQAAFVQTYLAGREFTVGILERHGRPEALAPLEVVPLLDSDGRFIYGFDQKENAPTTVSFEPVRDGGLRTRLAEVAVRCFAALGLRDGARADLRLDADGEVNFLEINPLPHLHPEIGDFCRSARESGLSYVELLDALVASGRRRWCL